MTPLTSRLLLYVLVDPAEALGKDSAEQARLALLGGATSIQLRSKSTGTRELVRVGKAILSLCRQSGALFIVNDRLDVALACGADGVHLGQEDLPIEAARAIASPGFLIGVSAHEPAEAIEAERLGADYLGVGAVFPTQTKRDVRATGIVGLRAVVKSTHLPCVGIGGITPARVPEVLSCGTCGVAVHSAVVGSKDVEAASRDFRVYLDLGRNSLA